MAEYSLELPGSHSMALPKTKAGTSATAAEHSSNNQIASLLHLHLLTNHLALHNKKLQYDIT